LAQSGVITDADRFYDFLRRDALAPKLRAGEYAFEGSNSPSEVARKIISGEVKVYRFTVPEGLRADEILEIVSSSELKLDLAKLSRWAGDPAFLRKAGTPADKIEGFLFPDTYTFTRSANEEAVLKKMIGRSLEEYGKLAADGKADPSLDEIQAFTLASII